MGRTFIRIDDAPARGALISGCLACILSAGCVGVAHAPEPATSAQGGSTTQGRIEPVAPAPVAPASKPAGQEPGATAPKTVAKEPLATAPAKPSVTPAPTPQIGKKESPAPVVAKQAPPPLDLTALETRLKESHAIGVFTKLSLKNQVDDLLGRFRAFYQGQSETSLAELRQAYDLLVLKVLSLLQDSDPSLANAIIASREAIWSILTDRKKFFEAL